MKLKKAMRKYPIEVKSGLTTPHYCLGDRYIYEVVGNPNHYWDSLQGNMIEHAEKQAVAWLIEGAEKLSPIQIAMRKHPDIVYRKDSGGLEKIRPPKRHTIKWALKRYDIRQSTDAGNPMYYYQDRNIVKRNSGIWYSIGSAQQFKDEVEAVEYLVTEPPIAFAKNNVLSGSGRLPYPHKVLQSKMDAYSKLLDSLPDELRRTWALGDWPVFKFHKCPTCGRWHKL